MQRLWITAEPFPTSPAVKALALAAGATQTVHADTGLPPTLAGLIPPGTVGYYELAEPSPPADDDAPPTPTNEERIAELEAALALAAGVLADLIDIIGGQ